MDNQKLIKFIQDNIIINEKDFKASRCRTNSTFWSENKKILDEIYIKTNFLQHDKAKLQHRLYCILNNITEHPKCVVCGSDKVNYSTKDVNYFSQTCSKECNNSNKNKMEKRKNTNLKKYGVENVFQSDSFKEKSKETKLSKYGDENFTNIEKAKKTTLDRYGDEKFKNSEKRLNTVKEKYGVENVFQLEVIQEKSKTTRLYLYDNINYNNREKAKQTNLDRYGIEFPMQSEEIQEKSKNSKLERYDDEWFTNREKGKETHFKKHGVYFPTQIQEVIDKTRNKKFKNYNVNHETQINIKNYNKYIDIQWWFDNSTNKVMNKTSKELSEYFNVDNSTINKKLQLLGIKYKNSSNTSFAEKEIVKFIKSIYSGEVILNNRSIISNNKEIDIFIPEYNLAIEYNGVRYHSSTFKNRDFHFTKTCECKQKNIQLLHIFECDWINKKDIFKSFISNKLHYNNKKIYARNCDIRYIESKEAMNFLENNHIQGKTGSNYKIGLYYKNELVSLMTFKDNELNRFCSKINTTVVGGFSRLLKHFISNCVYDNIVSYSDNTYSYGEIYKNNGFVKDYELDIDYFYVYKLQRFHKSNFMKSKIIKKFNLNENEINKTENELALNNNLFRIYDSGKIKWKLVLSEL